METVAVVTADSRSRVTLRGVQRGQRLRVSREGERILLDPVKEPAKKARLVKDKDGRLVADFGRVITQAEVKRAMEEML